MFYTLSQTHCLIPNCRTLSPCMTHLFPWVCCVDYYTVFNIIWFMSSMELSHSSCITLTQGPCNIFPLLIKTLHYYFYLSHWWSILIIMLCGLSHLLLRENCCVQSKCEKIQTKKLKIQTLLIFLFIFSLCETVLFILQVVGNGVTWRNLTQTLKYFKKTFYSNQFFYAHKISNILEFFLYFKD